MFTSPNSARRVAAYSLLIIALCMAILGLVACGESDTSTETSDSDGVISAPLTSVADGSTAPEDSEGSLIGTWHSDQTGETFEFKADGSLIVTDGDGVIIEMTYTADGNNLSYLIDGTVVYTGTYSVDGDILSQVDPDIAGTVYFNRVE